MKKIFAALIVSALVLGLASCGQKLNFGKKYIPANAQINVLQELASKTADIGIMDSVMSGFYMTTGSYKDSLMRVEGLVLADEQYGIAARKDAKDTIAKINDALVSLYKSGEMTKIASGFGLEGELIDITKIDYQSFASSSKADWNYIVKKGTLKIGYTVFAPIAFEEGTNLTGYDIELARAVAAKLGLKPEFIEINWDAKETELASKNIDLIWNGMTITPERVEAMSISVPYMKNQQMAVIRKADAEKYSAADFKEFIKKASSARVAAEAGSAGESCILQAGN